MRLRCVVCNRTSHMRLGRLCAACARSYDRARDSDATALSLITWAASRARRFNRASRARSAR
jgi:hypothetical protein